MFGFLTETDRHTHTHREREERGREYDRNTEKENINLYGQRSGEELGREKYYQNI